MAKDLKAKNDTLPVDFDFASDSGAGMDNADRDSFAIPFLRVLQKISPQCDEGDAQYVEGARGGMLFNSVTQKVYDGKIGVIFLPCAFQRRFIQWGPRSGEGQGYKGDFTVDQVNEMRAAGQLHEDAGVITLDGDRLVDTRSHFGLLIDDEAVTQVILALSSTQIKKSKQLMSMLSSARINGQQPPTWMNKIRITSVSESNDKGSWYGLRFEAEGFIESAALYEAGKSFHSTVSAGEAKVSYDSASEDDKF